MLIVMKARCTDAEIQQVTDTIKDLGYKPLPVPGPSRTAICITGNKDPIDEALFLRLSGVQEVIRVTKPYKLVSREVKEEDTVIKVGGVSIGGANAPVFFAGPCSVEDEKTTIAVAKAVKKAGAHFFRAGAFKPRTSPYEFQGLGVVGLKILKKVREETGLCVVSEVVDTSHVEEMMEYVDFLQVGTRNMHNYALLKKLSTIKKPVILKRGMCSSLEEWLNAAEYIVMGGNSQVILCERGIRTHSTHSRNTLDLNVVPVVRKVSHLPIIVDPSHGIGRRDFIRAMSRSALAAGAQGLIIESHTNPNRAYSDQAQTIPVETLKAILEDAKVLSQLEPSA